VASEKSTGFNISGFNLVTPLSMLCFFAWCLEQVLKQLIPINSLNDNLTNIVIVGLFSLFMLATISVGLFLALTNVQNLTYTGGTGTTDISPKRANTKGLEQKTEKVNG
jgi:hypothetical protein